MAYQSWRSGEGTAFPRIIAIHQLIASLKESPHLDRNIQNDRLPRKIAHPYPSGLLPFLLCTPCQVKVESDPAKLISNDLSSDITVIDIDICDHFFCHSCRLVCRDSEILLHCYVM